jgi:predicted DCC family thiol-disulfide oxidoreductase YuxK
MMNLRKLSEENPIVLFDGVCNLCNGAVQFIIRNDTKKVFRFAPLQKLDEGTKYETDEQVQLESKALSSIL